MSDRLLYMVGLQRDRRDSLSAFGVGTREQNLMTAKEKRAVSGLEYLKS